MHRLLLAFSLACLIPTNNLWAQPTSLTIGESVENDLGSHDAHSYMLDLREGQFVYGVVNQQTVDVVVTIYDPDDTLVGTFDSPARGPEPFQFNTESVGIYRIDVSPFQEESGLYAIRIHLIEPLAATPEGKVDQLMAMYGQDTPGGVVAVVEKGEVAFAKGYGMANLEYGVPNTPSTPYHMASVSKQFTAFAIVMLAQQGKLSLDDDIHKHIPELADFGEKINLRHLLNHTSGLRDQWSLWSMSGGRMDDVIRQDDLFRLIERQRELNFSPGAEYLYSNTGYMLLAKVVENVTGKDFGDWMETNVFEPLGMSSTQIYDDHERLVVGRAYSYGYGEGGIRKSVLSYANSGATSLFTTAEDIAKWIHNYHTMEVGGAEVWAHMQERGVLTSGDTLDYALGLVIDEHNGIRRIQHGGADAGYRTMLAYYPEIDAGVVVLSNLGSFNPGQVANEVAEAFFSQHMMVEEVEVASETEPAISVSPDLLDAYKGTFAIENGPIVNMIFEGNELYTQIEGQPRFALIALSDTLFRVDVPNVEAQISFHLERDGQVEYGTIHQNGETRIRRIEPWNPDNEELDDYAGWYFSPELETYYTIALKDSHLVALHRRHGEIELKPKEMDTFSGGVWFFNDVVFERDEADSITGMKVSNGRVRNLQFEKKD